MGDPGVLPVRTFGPAMWPPDGGRAAIRPLPYCTSTEPKTKLQMTHLMGFSQENRECDKRVGPCALARSLNAAGLAVLTELIAS